MGNDATPWLNDWVDKRELASGGQGVVAELQSLADSNKRAVLKRILPRWKGDSQAISRMEQEAEIISKLHSFPLGDLLDISVANLFTIKRHHFSGTAHICIIGIAEGMDIHLYAFAFNGPMPPNMNAPWSKIAVVDESQQKMSERTLNVVVEAMANMLAHQIRILGINRESK